MQTAFSLSKLKWDFQGLRITLKKQMLKLSSLELKKKVKIFFWVESFKFKQETRFWRALNED